MQKCKINFQSFYWFHSILIALIKSKRNGFFLTQEANYFNRNCLVRYLHSKQLQLHPGWRQWFALIQQFRIFLSDFCLYFSYQDVSSRRKICGFLLIWMVNVELRKGKQNGTFSYAMLFLIYWTQKNLLTFQNIKV